MTTVLIVIGSIVLVVWVLRHRELSRTLREEPSLRADPQAAPPNPAAMISVLIPARNEAENIGRTLEGLLRQNYPNFEVIVADDRSQDDTAAIVRSFATNDPRVRLVEHRELPKGWTGKTHVLWQISREARGDILLFLDADVALDPGALPVMVSYFVENHLDTFSMLLRLDSSSFWERVTRVLLGSTLMLRFPLKKVNDPKSSRAFANGQVIMMRAEVYRAIGGHESVKATLLDDVALAERVKQEGYRLSVVYGFDMAATRMYSSLADIWKGWSRIFYGSFQGRFTKLFFALGMLILFSLSPYFVLMVSGTYVVAGGASSGLFVLFLVSIAEIAAMLSVIFRLHRTSHCEAAYLVLNFVAALIALGILITAITRRFSSKGIIWKGTRYDTRPDAEQAS